MRVKEGFMLRQLGNQYVVVALGEAVGGFHGMIRLNRTGAYLWERLSERGQTEEQLVDAILEKYEIDRETAKADVEAFLSKIGKAGILD